MTLPSQLAWSAPPPALLLAQAEVPEAEAEAPAGPRWSSQCSSTTRNGPLECSVQQNAALNGRTVASVTIRIPPGQPPVLVMRVPSELNLQAGLKVQVDAGDTRTTEIETCDGTGCYGRMLLDDAAREALRAGSKLAVTFQTFANHRDVTIPFDLTGFAAEFDAIQ